MVYSRVNLSEKQGELEMEVKRLLRKKTDKDRSEALTERSYEFDDEVDDEFGEEIPQMTTKSAMWTIGAVVTALATIGMNICSVILTTGIVNIISCGIASLVSATVAVREPLMEDLNSEYSYMWCGDKRHQRAF
jgi:hypothetical protein